MIRVYLLFGLDSRRSDKNGTQQACVALVVHFFEYAHSFRHYFRRGSTL